MKLEDNVENTHSVVFHIFVVYTNSKGILVTPGAVPYHFLFVFCNFRFTFNVF